MIIYLDDPTGPHLTTYTHIVACAMENHVTAVNLGLANYAPYLVGVHNDVFSRYPACKSILPPTPARRATALRWARRMQRSLDKGKLKRWNGGWLRSVRSSSETTLGKSELEKQQMIVDMDSPEFRAHLRATRVVFVSGPLLRAQQSIRKHYPAVREFFSPTDEQQAAIDTVLNSLRHEGELLIGVHIRRAADFAKFMDGKYFYSIAQYRACMEKTRALFPDKPVRFLIQTDEPLTAEAFEPFKVGFARGERWMQVYALAGCDYLIGPPGTFLAWASFYNQVPHYKIMDPDRSPVLENFVINRG